MMKLWRKQAKKKATGEFDSITNIHTGEVLAKIPVIKRNGRDIKYQNYVAEMMGKQMSKSYPLLDALIQKGNLKFVMTKKEIETLASMSARAEQLEGESNAAE